MSKKLNKPVHLHILATEDALSALDRWRSRRVPPPTRSDAIRMILLDLDKDDPMKSEKD